MVEKRYLNIWIMFCLMNFSGKKFLSFHSFAKGHIISTMDVMLQKLCFKKEHIGDFGDGRGLKVSLCDLWMSLGLLLK